MLRTTSVLPHSVVRWMGQVAASVGATLVASLIYSALSRPALPEAARPELTSGGKFAVRAIEPAAFDGLDTMPLPQVAPRPVQAAILPAPVLPAPVLPAPVLPTPASPAEFPPAIRRVAFDAAAPLAPERPARAARGARGPARVEARRGGGAEPASQAVITAATPREAVADEATSEGGFVQALLPRVLPTAWPAVLPRVVSTARAAWTVTASAGESLVDRVVPQMP